MEDQKPHFLLVTFPVQGHINPTLQLAKRLLDAGANVTFSTSLSAYHRMEKSNSIPKGVTVAALSNVEDDDSPQSFSEDAFRQKGSEKLKEIFQKSAAEGKPVSCMVYTLLLSWVAEVARVNNVPPVLLCIQPATLFDIYYYYFNGYKDVIVECENDPSWCLKLPNFPFELKAPDLPSFLLPSNPHQDLSSLIPGLQEQMEELGKEKNPTVLVNTFDDLEKDMLRSIEKLKLIPVGPLLPSAFLDGKDPLDKSIGGDLFERSKDGDYIAWLDTQEKWSVIYVSFGSLVVLSKPQMEELARALIQTRKPFLWVIREKETKENEKQDSQNSAEEKAEEEELSCMEELKQSGLIVPWCSQVEVLSHPAIGCFVTHCGWNSTLESITSGVPLVGFPQWADQTTNAKLVQDVWKIGVRVNPSEEDGLVKSEELRRCLEMVMESEEMKENAKRWRDLAIQAGKEGGSSNRNLKAFIDQVGSQKCE